MNRDILQLAAMMTGDRSLVRGSRIITVETQESLNADDLKTLLDMEHKPGWFTFATRIIKPEDIIDLPPLDETKLDIKKSPSQRLRNVLYVYYEKLGGKKDNFDLWYVKEMERLIQHYKSKLEE